MDFDLESLVNVEQTFYEDGYKDGFSHGRIHGSIEGRALGREKGFEMWEEIGFYEGFALMWNAVYEKRNITDDRAVHHIRHLLELITQFPRLNPSATAPSELDIPKLFRQIRSRYKALCSTLGVRPTLRAADGSPAQLDSDDPDIAADRTLQDPRSRKVWSVDSQPQGGLSF